MRQQRRGVNTAVINLLASALVVPLGCGSTKPNHQDDIGQTGAAVTATLIWSDEFNTGSLDRSKWVVSDGAIDPANNSGSCFNS
jgi:hypothetical protein